MNLTGTKTHLVLIGVHRFSVQPFLSRLPVLLDMFADPYIPIQPQDEVYVAR